MPNNITLSPTSHDHLRSRSAGSTIASEKGTFHVGRVVSFKLFSNRSPESSPTRSQRDVLYLLLADGAVFSYKFWHLIRVSKLGLGGRIATTFEYTLLEINIQLLNELNSFQQYRGKHC